VITQELAMGFNCIITPLFWLWLSPSTFFADLKKHDYVGAFFMMAHHTFPMLASAGNLYLNEQYFLKKNGRQLFIFGLLYIPTNYVGTKIFGEPIYPGPGSWSNPLVSLIFYLLQTPVLYFIQEKVATYTQSIYKPK
jgi:hypothetical protein